MYQTIYPKILILLFVSIIFTNAKANKIYDNSARTKVNLNKNWLFAKDPHKVGISALKFTSVNIPHTWNAFDVMDDEPGYYRGIGWYKKKLTLNSAWKNKNISIYFEGANQETEVYLNGKKVGSHVGGYSGFIVPLNGLKFNGTDEISVKVNNSYNENIAPLTADFTFFGGIYRSVSLLVLEQAHFNDDKYGSMGVYVHAENVSKDKSTVIVNGKLTNNLLTNELLITTEIKDADGQKVGESKFLNSANAGKTISFQLPKILVSQPKLWSPEKPYLYTATTKLIAYKTGKILDEVITNVGLRFFSFDAKNGFFLNGSPYKLIGASRHQDFAKMGNAVPKDLQVKDVVLLKEMGGNFLRVAHYPQDQAVLDACDSLGILASVEIPIVNEITETDTFTANCKMMQLEMIKQNYNHPSIIIWAYMNEVLLRMKFSDEPERKKIYLANIERLAQELEDLTRSTDPTRYTMMANHGDINGYVQAGLTKIPMLVGWNLYQGWYGGKSEDFGPNLDRIHAQIPDKPHLVTEYGADVDPRIHAFNPIRFDKSLEYGMLYHQIYIKDILKRPFIAGAMAWNLSDFNSETRDETMPHINNKGLLTLDRKPKNTYYLYKANFNKTPFLKIGDGSWSLRGEIGSSTNTNATQLVQVISNTDSVMLYINGVNLGKKKVVDAVTNWEVPFKNGKNEITAEAFVNGLRLEDKSIINFVLQPFYINENSNFQSLNILLGSERQFIDEENKEVWLPSKSYQKGSWGSIGGEPFKIKNSSRQLYGTDKNIRGTANDPIYQTQLIDLESYNLDLPKGKYELTLHFAELVGHSKQNNLPYNLDSLIAVNKEVPAQRIFDVYLNDKLIINKLNIAANYGVANSVKKKFTCIVTDDSGIKLVFKAITGKPVLNALQVRKIK